MYKGKRAGEKEGEGRGGGRERESEKKDGRESEKPTSVFSQRVTEK